MPLPLSPKCWGFKHGTLLSQQPAVQRIKSELLPWPLTALQCLTTINSHLFWGFHHAHVLASSTEFPVTISSIACFFMAYCFANVLCGSHLLIFSTWYAASHSSNLDIPHIVKPSSKIQRHLIPSQGYPSSRNMLCSLFLVCIDFPPYPCSGIVLYISDLFNCKFFYVRHYVCFIHQSVP